MRSNFLRVLTEYARKASPVDAEDEFERQAFVSRIFAELTSQVIPKVLRGHAPDLQAVGALVQEEPRCAHALRTMHKQRSLTARALRLSEEAELANNTKLCATFHQQLLTLAETKENPKHWLAYAKFLCRVRGRNMVAENAVKQGINLMSDDESVRGAKHMLAALLLSRGRYQDVEDIVGPLHLARRSDPVINCIMGLNYFLAFDDAERGARYLHLCSKPKEFFRGVTTDEKMFEKLSLFISAGDAMSSVGGGEPGTGTT